ncbi:hypothetical protein [Acinetobacter higginsii]|uniref:hypothetical protein n=1 Tax=Acinetobacter higginsii TaxID=70347 RepID=UPI002674B32F|nr:hypothetical protein [Acinetobacter higginsii]MDO3663433.1 hypothetical protein [Acinetobacter higginsii]
MFEYINHEKEVKKIFSKYKGVKCCYYDCNKSSTYSHIISKSISINEIAENGHILKFSPRRNQYVKHPEFELAGIQENPAFNGFCSEHEILFEPIDKNVINNFYGVYLQLFRSISSHKYFSKIGRSIFPNIDLIKAEELIKKQVTANLTEAGKSIDEEKLNKVIALTIENFKEINYEKNKIIQNEDKLLEKFKFHFHKEIKLKNKKLFENNFRKDRLFTFEYKDEDIPFKIFFYQTNFKIPVAVNAIHIFGRKSRENFNIFNIIPYSDSSIIIGLIDLKLQNRLLDKILNKIDSTFNRCDNSISILNFVESIVISSSDYSYFPPSLIQNMDQEKQDFVANDFMFLNEFQNGDKYLDNYDSTIFDELRATLNINRNLIDPKLSSQLPERLSYDERYKRMKEKIDKENPILIALSKTK